MPRKWGAKRKKKELKRKTKAQGKLRRKNVKR